MEITLEEFILFYFGRAKIYTQYSFTIVWIKQSQTRPLLMTTVVSSFMFSSHQMLRHQMACRYMREEILHTYGPTCQC